MSSRLNEEKGIILPIVLVFTLVLMITGLVFVSLPVQENSLVRKEIVKRQAFYLAEAGVEDARVQLGQDWEGWEDYTPISAGLGVGNYHADISESELGSNWREVTSTGTVEGKSKTVVVTLSPSLPSGVTKGIKAAGEVIVSGHATVTGDIEENSTSFEDPDAYFKEVFGVTKTEMKEIAQDPPNRYYDSAITSDTVENITWVDGGGEMSKIDGNWTGSGIFIIDGSLEIAGTYYFAGIIWVTGSLTIAAGTAEINGAIFVESDTTVELTGNLTLTYDSEEIKNTFGDNLGSTGPVVESWQEEP